MRRLPADPMRFAKLLWPGYTFYKQQREIIYSVRDNDETFVKAGNKLGKDFTAAFIILWFFLTRHPCRIVTTSVDSTQLEVVLWGEIRRFIQTCHPMYPIEYSKGMTSGVVINFLHLRKMVDRRIDGLSYVIGRVAAQGEGLQGHHLEWGRMVDGQRIPHTLFVGDEASSLDDADYNAADTWAHRKLIFGNPLPCTNFYYRGCKEGDLLADEKPVWTGAKFGERGL